MPKERHPDIFMPWFIMDYQKDTMHLTLEEDGLYRRMLDMHWLTKGRGLPDDDMRLANTLRVDMPTWLRLKPVMMPFFEIGDGVWLNRRNYAEYVGRVAAMESASERGKAAAEVRWGNAGADANAHAQALPDALPEQYHSESELESESEFKIKARAKAGTQPPALAKEVEEELLTRTVQLVGREDFEKNWKLYRRYMRDHKAAYRDALADAESRKKEAALGLPEAQIDSNWAKYLIYTFKQTEKAYHAR